MLRRFGLILLAVLLLAAMAAQLVHLASFEVRRAGMRKEMKQHIREGLPEADLVRFTFTAAQFAALDKEDGGKEFWMEGHIYDVVRYAVSADGSVHIEAVDDRDEARLMADLGDLLQIGMERRGLGRGRASSVIALLATAMPEGRSIMMVFPLLEGVMASDQRAAFLERSDRELLRPPRG